MVPVLNAIVFMCLLPATLAWFCVPIQEKNLREGVIWKTQNCSQGTEGIDLPLLVVNSVHVDLGRSDIRVVPAIADPVEQVQSLPDIGNGNSKFVAGIIC